MKRRPTPITKTGERSNSSKYAQNKCKSVYYDREKRMKIIYVE